jgi:hypothetical protein
MLRMTVYAILLIVITFEAQALTEARLLNQSRSGQTAVFNLGSFDGIKEGDYAVILKQIRDIDTQDLRVIPAARARNIKLNSDSSVWILYHIYDQELFVKNEKFVLLSESHMLSGRRPPQLGRIRVVTQKDKAAEQAGYASNEDKDRLSKLKNNYQTITPTHENTAQSDNDADLVDLEVWKKNNKLRYSSALYKSPHKKEFQRQLNLATFEKLVTAYLERVNDPDFNYDQFYELQKKDAFSQHFNLNTNYDSEYNRFLRRESTRSSADAKLFRSILEKGESWSADYSDEELKNVLTQVSELQEKDRRLFVIAKPTRYSWAFDYGQYLTDAQTKNDPQYRKESRYSTEVDFEATPFLKHEKLERFTLNTSFRLNHTAFEANSFNANFNEYSFTFGTNWYPWYAPYAVESPVFFLGAYLRSGYGKADVPTIGEKANYTILSLPGLRVGMKYYMRNNWGLRFIMSFETLKIERYEASKFSSVLPENTNLVEGKFGFGLTHAF